MQKVGMRNIKTAISVFICMIILNRFQNTSPFYACIAAVITMQGTVYGSFSSGKSRMIGTIIGATWGLALALISPSSVLLTTLGIISVIYILSFFKKKDSISIACVVFLSIMLNIRQDSALIYSLKRVAETFIGISIAVLVNYFVFPPNYLDKIQKHSKLLIDIVFSISKDVLNFNTNVNLSIINEQISKLQTSLDSYSSEIIRLVTKEHTQIEVNKLIENSRSAYNNLITLASLSSSLNDFHINEKNCAQMSVLFNENVFNIDYTSNDLNTVFNFHVKSLLESLTILQKNNSRAL